MRKLLGDIEDIWTKNGWGKIFPGIATNLKFDYLGNDCDRPHTGRPAQNRIRRTRFNFRRRQMAIFRISRSSRVAICWRWSNYKAESLLSVGSFANKFSISTGHFINSLLV